FIRRSHLGARRVVDDLGLFCDRRQRSIQHAGHGVSSGPHGGNRSHGADFSRLPADDAANAAGPTDCAANWLALGLRDSGDGPSRWNRSDSYIGYAAKGVAAARRRRVSLYQTLTL